MGGLIIADLGLMYAAGTHGDPDNCHTFFFSCFQERWEFSIRHKIRGQKIPADAIDGSEPSANQDPPIGLVNNGQDGIVNPSGGIDGGEF